MRCSKSEYVLHRMLFSDSEEKAKLLSSQHARLPDTGGTKETIFGAGEALPVPRPGVLPTGVRSVPAGERGSATKGDPGACNRVERAEEVKVRFVASNGKNCKSRGGRSPESRTYSLSSTKRECRNRPPSVRSRNSIRAVSIGSVQTHCFIFSAVRLSPQRERPVSGRLTNGQVFIARG